MPKIIQFNSLGGSEVLEFKDIVLSKELGSDEVLYSVKAFKYLLEYDVMGKIVVEIDSK